MNPFALLTAWFKRTVHVKAATLKGTPFLVPGQEQAAADHINAVIGSAVDDEVARHGITPEVVAAHAGIVTTAVTRVTP